MRPMRRRSGLLPLVLLLVTPVGFAVSRADADDPLTSRTLLVKVEAEHVTEGAALVAQRGGTTSHAVSHATVGPMPDEITVPAFVSARPVLAALESVLATVRAADEPGARIESVAIQPNRAVVMLRASESTLARFLTHVPLDFYLASRRASATRGKGATVEIALAPDTGHVESRLGGVKGNWRGYFGPGAVHDAAAKAGVRHTRSESAKTLERLGKLNARYHRAHGFAPCDRAQLVSLMERLERQRQLVGTHIRYARAATEAQEPSRPALLRDVWLTVATAHRVYR